MTRGCSPTTPPGASDGRRASCAPAGLVAMPTDTVYGVGVALEAPDGLPRLFAAKDRPLDRAIVLLVADLEQAATVGVLYAGGPSSRGALLARRSDARAGRRLPVRGCRRS